MSLQGSQKRTWKRPSGCEENRVLGEIFLLEPKDSYMGSGPIQDVEISGQSCDGVQDSVRR